MTTTTSHITGINVVMVPTTDPDRSIEFYERALGFEKRADIPFGDGDRWIEVGVPGGATAIALTPTGDSFPVGQHTGISLTTDDIDATHAHLASAGADVDAEVARMGDPVPPMFWFRDPEGNTLMVVEAPSA